MLMLSSLDQRAPRTDPRQARVRFQLDQLLVTERGSHPMALEQQRVVARFFKFRVESRLIPLTDTQGRFAGTLARSWIGSPDGRALDGQTLRALLRDDAPAQRSLQALCQRVHACNHYLMREGVRRQGPLHLPLAPGETADAAVEMLQRLGLDAAELAVLIAPQSSPAQQFRRRGLHVGISLARETWASQLPEDLHAAYVHIQPQRWAGHHLASLRDWAQAHAARIIRHGALLTA